MIISRIISIMFGCLLFVGMFALPAGADIPSKKKTKTSTTLDEQLLKGLDNELLQGLGDLPTDPARENNRNNKSNRPQRDGKNQNNKNSKKSVDPFESIGRKMQTVQRRIDASDTTSQTQKLQQDILDQLTTLIHQAQKKCSGSQGKPSSKPGSPSQKPSSANPGQSKQAAKESTVRQGKTNQEVDVQQDQTASELFKNVWGHLPEHVRRQMQSVTVERFLPKYEKLIEQYYKRLAEQQTNQP